jgi:alkaline phosphatase D
LIFSNRREFLQRAVASAGWAAALGGRASAIVRSERGRPTLPCGVQSGDVAGGRAIVWSRTDRPARMIVEHATTESFRNARRIVGPDATPATDFTARVDLSRLPGGQRVFYRVRFEDLADGRAVSEAVTGSFTTPPSNRRDVSFVWGGDVCGQGWGINPEFGGMKIFEAMRRRQPDFLIHSGDAIYADGVILPEVKLPDGSIWKNVTAPEKSKVAETLDEFRGNYRYNLLDEPLRRFNAETAVLAQWDDHEVRNNWYPGQILTDEKYVVKDVNVLAARARQAFLEYLPLRPAADDPHRIFRAFNRGPLLDVLMLDERSYRGGNSPNRQATIDRDSAMLGSAQVEWIKQRLLASRAVWKVIASDMPIGIVIRDGANFEAFSNGDAGPPLGRELELAGLLRFIKARRIQNVVWVTADIHYAAAHYYDPAKAKFVEFDPFWEFVAGPFHAGTYGPTPLDPTFGPEVKFQGIPGKMNNQSPKDGFQFFGAVKIDGRTGLMTVSLHDIDGRTVYSVELAPQART